MSCNIPTKQWITPTGEKIIWNSETVHMMNLMFHMLQNRRLPFIASVGAHLMRCSRCCVILQKDSTNGKEKKLVIAAGHPEYEHGIGNEISPELGKDFLESVIRGGKIVSIADPKNDPRVAYMKSLIIHRGIRSLIFVPLYYKKLGSEYVVNPFGIMAFDYTNKDPERKLEKDNREVREIVSLAVSIILNEQKRTREIDELIKVACFGSLAQHSLGIQDAIRNLLQITPYHKKLLKKVEESQILTQQIEEIARTIEEANAQFFSKAEDVLSGAKFSPNEITLGEHNLQNLLEDLFDQKQTKESGIDVKLDFGRLTKKKIRIDYKKLRECFAMIFSNAIKYGAKNIFIEAFSRKSLAGPDKNIVTFSRDGTKLSILMIDQAFTLFGLSTAKNIIEAHKGKISVTSFGKTTRFVIHLPAD